MIKLFTIKEEQAERIKRRYKLSTMAEEVGISTTLITFIFKKLRPCSKKTAYAITKYIDSEAEIDDFFVRVDKGD